MEKAIEGGVLFLLQMVRITAKALLKEDDQHVFMNSCSNHDNPTIWLTEEQ
jgi:hypothetical protein